MNSASDFIIENGVLTKYVGPGGDVTVPEGVTAIGDSAFEWCKSLQSVAIPESVRSIGEYAFAYSNVVLSGPAGSYAEAYAKENNIPFVAE